MSESTDKAKPATSWALERLNGADLSPTGESFLIRASCPLRRQVEKGGTVHDLDAILGVNLAVSRQHAEVYLGGEGGIGIVDRGSRNGTFVKRVDPTKGDELKFKTKKQTDLHGHAKDAGGSATIDFSKVKKAI